MDQKGIPFHRDDDRLLYKLTFGDNNLLYFMRV